MSSNNVAERLAELRAAIEKEPGDAGTLSDFEYLAQDHGKVAELEDLYVFLLDRGDPELVAEVASSLFYLYEEHEQLTPDWDAIVTVLNERTGQAHAEDHHATDELVRVLEQAASESEGKKHPPILKKIARQKAEAKAAAKKEAQKNRIKGAGFAALAVGGLAGLFGVLGIVVGSLQSKDVSSVSKWRSTPGTVTKTWSARERGAAGRYFYHYPKLSYRYVVAGKAYQANKVELHKTPRFGTKKEAEQFLQPFRETPAVTVYYDPKNPSKAALNHKSYKKLANKNRFGGIIAVVVCVLLLPLGFILLRRSRA